jgi:stringent starvation protein B
MSIPSRRPYLIRAIYDWAIDNKLTPYLVVAADYPGVAVPPAHVREGRIAFDISPVAVRGLDLHRNPIYFSARFGGVAQDIWIPAGSVLAIYARENGEGILFGETEAAPSEDTSSKSAGGEGSPPDAPKPGGGRPKLRVVK